MSNPVPAPERFITQGAAGAPRWDGRTLSWPVRVYYHHTDAGGVVYHGTYLDFMEASRTELLHALGFDLAELAHRDAVQFIVYSLAVDYHKPARLNDRLTVTAAFARVGGARIEFDQRVMRGDELLVSAKVKAACVHPATYRPVAVPEALREKLQR
ncbi:MAG TPA: tol-pal system-associated acyl-CoA thioesterase [Burkholderiales bacterium]|nr:tol-pal system-associated acyl-CoA thioesterase [Burkholderiales bacterium]